VDVSGVVHPLMLMTATSREADEPAPYRKILGSPLLHFFLIGLMIFAAFSVLNDDAPPPRSDAIILTEDEAGELADRFAATWGRPPTPAEKNSLIKSWVVEEAYVREALALGLDRGDTVIRQRLKMKMQFLAESGAGALVPDDAALQAFLDANRERFLRPERVAFEQVFLPPDQGRAASAIRIELEDGAAPSAVGEASLLPSAVPLTPADAVERMFGADFYASLATLPVGVWRGPVQSAYGAHLVRVTGRMDAFAPPLSEIRDRVEGEWRAEKRREMRDDFGKALLERHTVILPAAKEAVER
jgi:hypothetical protein